MISRQIGSQSSNGALPREQASFPFAGHLIAALIVAGFLLRMLSLAGSELDVFAAIAVYAGAVITIGVGEIVLSLFACSAMIARALMATLTGAIVTSILLLASSFITGLPTGQLLIWSGVAVLPLTWAVSRRRPASTGTAWQDLAAMAVAAIIVAIWCHDFAQSATVLEATNQLHAWDDNYVHGAQLAEFGDRLAVGRGAILFADYPRVFYHYGMYMLPSTVLGAVNASGLAIAVAFLTPLGLFLGLTASFVLASQLSCRLAGIAAVACLTALPDAAQYGFKNGFYSFHWLLFTTPGAGYGIAACCVALILFVEWYRTRATATLVGAIIISVAIFQLRVHFLIWFAPAIVTSFLLQLDFIRRNPRRWLGAIAGGSLSLIVVVASLEPIRHFWLSHSVVEAYLNLAYRSSEPNNYAGLYDWLTARLGDVPTFFVAALLLLPAAFGVLLLAYPLTLSLAMRTHGWIWTPFDTFPLALIAVFIGMTLYAPAAGGLIDELQHRSFVFLYVVLAVWNCAYVFRGTPLSFRTPAARWGLAGLVPVCVALKLLTNFDPARPHFNWGKSHYDTLLNPGIISAAQWIRGHATHGNTIALAPVDSAALIADSPTALASFTNLPEYLARAGSQLKQDPARRAVAEQRLQRLEKIEQLHDAESVFQLLKEARVTYFVWLAVKPPSFDSQYSRAVFHDANVSIYQTNAATKD
ncbi:hypothetical protein [Bradyrhizobium sp. S69]|uniref:hypothetical protein n=1 Tax=Bradyrhizobium sp. S69 TaxID=1641856 RepID=UPI00131C1FA1|nr:hypothetical protein [Bradyrhizobium sp. S69]